MQKNATVPLQRQQQQQLQLTRVFMIRSGARSLSGLQTLRKLSKRSENSQDNKDCSTFTFMMISLLHDQWLILKQVLLQCHMHNSGHKESDQSLLPAFTAFLLELGFPFCAIDQPCNSATVLGCREPRGIQRTQQQKDIPKRIKQPTEKNCNSSSSNIRYLFSNSVSNLLMMMMMMIFSTSVVQNLAGNNRYSCQRFSSSVCSSDADPQEAFPTEEKKRRSDEEKVERKWRGFRTIPDCRSNAEDVEALFLFVGFLRLLLPLLRDSRETETSRTLKDFASNIDCGEKHISECLFSLFYFPFLELRFPLRIFFAIACSVLSICPETGFANYELQKRVDTSSSFGKFLRQW